MNRSAEDLRERTTSTDTAARGPKRALPVQRTQRALVVASLVRCPERCSSAKKWKAA